MPQQTLRGFAWYTYPDFFGVEPEEVGDPGHPFASRPGEVQPPVEVIYFRPAHPGDDGLRNEQHAKAYLVLTKTQHHPRVSQGWDSEPAKLTDKFKTQDGRVKLAQIVEVHHRHAGDLFECVMKVDPD